jgi:hypothetical protein
MDIHKPKPVHSWKEFLSEILVVVVGVSIALTAESAIEALYWRDQVRIAHEALANDMDAIVGIAAEREAYSTCIDQKLNRWRDVIEEGGRTGRFPPQGAVHRAPRRLWTLSSWGGLTSAGVATHLSRDELYRLSLVTFYLGLAEQTEGDENAQWVQLYTLVGPGRPVESGELVELRLALSRARSDAKWLRLSAAQISRMIEGTHILSQAREQQAKKAYLTAPTARCLPDEPVPAHYGDGPPAGQPLDKPYGR